MTTIREPDPIPPLEDINEFDRSGEINLDPIQESEVVDENAPEEEASEEIILELPEPPPAVIRGEGSIEDVQS
jgi:hypothetical protein